MAVYDLDDYVLQKEKCRQVNVKRDAYNAMHRAKEKVEKKMEKGKEAQAAQASTPHPMLGSMSSGSMLSSSSTSVGSQGVGTSGGGVGSGKLDSLSGGSGIGADGSKDAKKKKDQKESKEAKEAAKNASNHQKVASDLAVARREFQAVNTSFQRYLRQLHARARFDFSQRTAAFLYAHKSYYQQGMTVYEYFGEDLLAVMTEMEEARKEFEANPNLEEEAIRGDHKTGAQRMSMFLALDQGASGTSGEGGAHPFDPSKLGSSSSPSANMHHLNKQGYMYKQSHKKVGKGWSMRWFMLEQSTLSWYSNWKDTQPSGTLTLNLCRIKALPDKPLCMEILQASPEVRIILRTLTEKDFASWHSALLQAIAYSLAQDPPPPNVSASMDGDAGTGSSSSQASNASTSLLLPPYVSKRIPLDTQDVLIQIQMASGIINLKETVESENIEIQGAEGEEKGQNVSSPSSPREGEMRRSDEGASASSEAHIYAHPSSTAPSATGDEGDDEHDTEEDRKKKKQRKKRSGKFNASVTNHASPKSSSATTGIHHPAVNPQLSQSLLLSWLRRMHPSNQYCADCAAPNPDWCSINTGAILCIDCSGVHRSLGSHISKVRSLNMDSLKPAVQRFLLDVGNHTVNAIFEAKLGRSSSSSSSATTAATEEAHHKDSITANASSTPNSSNTSNTSAAIAAGDEEDVAPASASSSLLEGVKEEEELEDSASSSSLSYEALDDANNTAKPTSPATASKRKSAGHSATTSSDLQEDVTTRSTSGNNAASSAITPPASPRLSGRNNIQNRRHSPESSTSAPATSGGTTTTSALGRVKDLSKKESAASTSSSSSSSSPQYTKPTPNADRATRTKFIYAKYVDLKFVKKKGQKALQHLASESNHGAFLLTPQELTSTSSNNADPNVTTSSTTTPTSSSSSSSSSSAAHFIHLTPSLTLPSEPTSHRLVRDLIYRNLVHEKLEFALTPSDHPIASRTRSLNRALLRLVYEWKINVKFEREGRNWVHEAAAANSPPCVSFFALQGCPSNVATPQVDGQWYPVHFAAVAGSVECIQLVASTPNECAVKDAKGRSPLDVVRTPEDVAASSHLRTSSGSSTHAAGISSSDTLTGEPHVTVNDESKRMKKMNSKRMSKMMMEQQVFAAAAAAAAAATATATATAAGSGNGGDASSHTPTSSHGSVESLSEASSMGHSSSSGPSSHLPPFLSDGQLDVIDYLSAILLPSSSSSSSITTPDLLRKDSTAISSNTHSPSNSSSSVNGATLNVGSPATTSASSTAASGAISTRPSRPGPSIISAKVDEVRKRSWTLSGRSAKEANKMQQDPGFQWDRPVSPQQNGSPATNAGIGTGTGIGTGPVIIGGSSGDSTVAVPTPSLHSQSSSPQLSTNQQVGDASVLAHSGSGSGSIDISRPFGTEQPKFMSLRLKQKHSQHGPLSSIFGAASSGNGTTGSTGLGFGSPLSSSTSSVAPPPPSLPSSPITLSSSQNVSATSSKSVAGVGGGGGVPPHLNLTSRNSSGSIPSQRSSAPSPRRNNNNTNSPTRIKVSDDANDGGVGSGGGALLLDANGLDTNALSSPPSTPATHHHHHHHQDAMGEDLDVMMDDSSDEELQNALRSGELMLDALISTDSVSDAAVDIPLSLSPRGVGYGTLGTATGSGSGSGSGSGRDRSFTVGAYSGSDPIIITTTAATPPPFSKTANPGSSTGDSREDAPSSSSSSSHEAPPPSSSASSHPLDTMPKEKRGSGIFSRSSKKDKEAKSSSSSDASASAGAALDEKKSKKSKRTSKSPRSAESNNKEEEASSSVKVAATASSDPPHPSSSTSSSDPSSGPSSSPLPAIEESSADKDSSSKDKKKDKDSSKDKKKDKDSSKDKDGSEKEKEKKKIRPWALLRSFSVRETKKESSPPNPGPPAESLDAVRASRSFWKNLDRKNSEEQIEKKKISPSPSQSSVASSKASTADIEKTQQSPQADTKTVEGTSSSNAATATSSSSAPSAVSSSSSSSSSSTTSKKRSLQRSSTMATPSSSNTSLETPKDGPAPRASISPRKNSKKSLKNTAAIDSKSATDDQSGTGIDVTATPAAAAGIGGSANASHGAVEEESSSATIATPRDPPASSSSTTTPSWNGPSSSSSPVVKKERDANKRFTRANKNQSSVAASSAASSDPKDA